MMTNKDITEEVGRYYKFIRSLETMSTKKWYASKTIWWNVIVFVVAVLALPEFIAILPPQLLPISVFIGAVGNMILRTWFTNKKIA